MKTIVKVLVPVTLAFGAIGAASAQSFVVETDYPGPIVQSAASTATSAPAAPYLIQSSQGAVQVNPADEQSSVTREEVRSKARLSMPVSPAFNA